MVDFRGKVALVTGGASGLGAGMAAALLERGSMVVLADIDLPRAEALVRKWSVEQKGTAEAVRLDVTSADEVSRVVDDVVQRHGRIDLLFNNAGIAVGGEYHELGLPAVRRVLDVNLVGAAQVMHAVYRVMVRQRHGHIVNTASMYGLIPGAYAAPYAAAKHGVVGLSQSVEAEGRGFGVTFTLVCPGFVSTNLFEAGEYSPGLDGRQAAARVPFRFLSAQRAVEIIISGVGRGRRLVVFPLYARVLWWAHRMCPWLLVALSAAEVRRQRRRHPPAAA